jgi:hypothetical protein
MQGATASRHGAGKAENLVTLNNTSMAVNVREGSFSGHGAGSSRGGSPSPSGEAPRRTARAGGEDRSGWDPVSQAGNRDWGGFEGERSEWAYPGVEGGGAPREARSGAPCAKRPQEWKAMLFGAGDGNRARAVSLGTVSITAHWGAELGGRSVLSDRG